MEVDLVDGGVEVVVDPMDVVVVKPSVMFLAIPEQPNTDLGPFESVGLDMLSWQGKLYLLVVDRMSG